MRYAVGANKVFREKLNRVIVRRVVCSVVRQTGATFGDFDAVPLKSDCAVLQGGTPKNTDIPTKNRTKRSNAGRNKIPLYRVYRAKRTLKTAGKR